MNLPVVVLSAFAFVLAAIGYSSPFFVAVVTTSVGKAASFNVGTLIMDQTTSGYTIGQLWCLTASSSSTYCSSFAVLSLATLVLYGIGVLAAAGGIAIAAVLDSNSIVPLWTLSLSWLCQAAGIFVFFFRALPLFEAHFQSTGAATTAWSFGWASYCALAGIVFTFVAVVVSGIRATSPAAQIVNEPKNSTPPSL